MILHIIMLGIMPYLNAGVAQSNNDIAYNNVRHKPYLNVGVAQSNNDIAYNNVRHNALFECRCSSI